MKWLVAIIRPSTPDVGLYLTKSIVTKNFFNPYPIEDTLTLHVPRFKSNGDTLRASSNWAGLVYPRQQEIREKSILQVGLRTRWNIEGQPGNFSVLWLSWAFWASLHAQTVTFVFVNVVHKLNKHTLNSLDVITMRLCTKNNKKNSLMRKVATPSQAHHHWLPHLGSVSNFPTYFDNYFYSFFIVLC